MQTFTLHTHSLYSDGKSSLDEMCDEAAKQQLNAIGFSEHSPLPFDNNFSVKADDMPKYIADTQILKEKYSGKMHVLRALEADYITNVTEPFAQTQQKYNLDYIIGGVHLVGQSSNPDEIWFIDGPDSKIYDDGLTKFFGGDIQRAVRRFYEQTNEMLENENFDIIAHFDKIKMHNRNRYFQETEKWYRNLALETLSLIAEKGIIMEINTRGIYKKRCPDLYPSPWLIKEAFMRKIPVVISSDAHHRSELTLVFDYAEKVLKNAGYKELTTIENGHYNSHPF